MSSRDKLLTRDSSFSMTSLSTAYYTNLYPMRTDVTGTADQAYNLTSSKYFDHIIGGINAGTIAALGTLAPGSSTLTYMYAPRIHTDLSGAFIGFVANSSNKIGEFSCVFVGKEAFGLFPIINTKSEIVGGPDAVSTVTPIREGLLSDTDWSSMSDSNEVVGRVFPNFFIIYFGQNIPRGDLGSDDVKMSIANMGPGYAAWVRAADYAINSIKDISTVFENARDAPDYSEAAFVKSHFFADFDSRKSLPLVSGPYGLITLVDSDLYKVEADEIKKFYFTPATPALSTAISPAALSSITLTLPKDAEKEAEAKKGIYKLLLFHVCGDIASDNTIAGELSYARPSSGMEVVLETTRSARATGLADLIRNICVVTKEHDCMNIRSRLCNLHYVNKAACTHILQGNFATEMVTSLNNEANAVDPSLFLPQKNKCMLEKEQSTDQHARSENSMDVLDTHKSKVSVAISRIGTMTNMADFSSLCINNDTVAGAMISADGPQPLWRKILMKFIELLNNPDFDTWHGLTGDAMPLLHWHVYTYLERIFNHFAMFATNFNNVNVISKERPITELDKRPLLKAMLVLKTFEDQLTLHMSQMIPITIQAANVSKYSLSPYNKTNACPPAASAVSDNSSPESREQSANKRTPSSPSDSAKEATTQRKKKSRRDGITDSATKKRPVTDMGMFHALTTAKVTDIFPKDMPDKICADFTCKGRECTRENCSFKHPRSAKELQKETIAMIAKHFASKKVGWFNDWHFSQVDGLPAEAISLLGGKDGPGKPSGTRKTA